MSSINIERIKQIRKKTTNGTANGFNIVPLGADGSFIDMVSGLDLEEQLKLGGNHSASINIIDDKTTQIKEYYYDNQNSKILKYSVLTTIFERGSKVDITATLYKGEINQNNILHIKTTTINETSSSIIQVEQEVNKE